MCFIELSIPKALTINNFMNFFNDKILLQDFQSRLRKHHSTDTALVKVTNDFLTSSDAGLISVPVLLDLSPAFNTIDHYILQKRMEH